MAVRGSWNRNNPSFRPSYLHEKDGQPGKGQHERVSDQKGPASMPKAQNGEPPDVAEADGVAEAGEEEVALVVPVAAVGLLLVTGGLFIVVSFTHLASLRIK